MNLPTNINSKGLESSSDSDEGMGSRKSTHVIDDLKRKSNQNKFQLK